MQPEILASVFPVIIVRSQQCLLRTESISSRLCFYLTENACIFFSQCTRMLRMKGARGSVVVEAVCYKPEGRGIKSRWGGFFLIYLILPAAQ
jgi:hypothetical protein